MKYDFTTVVDRTQHGASKWEIMNKVRKVDEGVIPFSVADMEFKTAPEITEGLKKILDEYVLGYTMPLDGYYNAIINWMKNKHQYEIKKEWILPTPGVVGAVCTLVQSYAKKGEGVILFTPTYPPFNTAILQGECIIQNCDLVRVDNHYEIDFETFEKLAKDPNNTVFILCSPHNPTGKVFTREELTKVADICVENNVLIIADEIHHDLVFPGKKHTVLATLGENYVKNVVTTCAPSKTFNIAGLKASMVIIEDEELREQYKVVCKRNHVGSLNMMAIKATEIAYNECGEWLDGVMEVILENRRVLDEFFKERLPKLTLMESDATYLAWIDFSKYGLSDEQLDDVLMNQAQIYMSEGHAYGTAGSQFERMNIACPTSEVKKALIRLETVLKQFD